MDVSEELEKVKIMSEREAVIKALSHEYVFPVPYCLNMTDDVARRVTEATGDPDFAEHAGSYLVTEINESFVDLEDGRFRDMFGVVWYRGRAGKGNEANHRYSQQGRRLYHQFEACYAE